MVTRAKVGAGSPGAADALGPVITDQERVKEFFEIADHDCFRGPKQKGPTEQNAP